MGCSLMNLMIEFYLLSGQGKEKAMDTKILG
jgi:hypothetical protein